MRLPLTQPVSPAILVAWDLLPEPPHEGVNDCGFAPGAPTRVAIRGLDGASEPADLQPLATLFDPERIRTLFAPFESDLQRIRWVAVLDPDRLRPDTRLSWLASRPCAVGTSRPTAAESAVPITSGDIARWRGDAAARP
jgi:hypothetical protein